MSKQYVIALLIWGCFLTLLVFLLKEDFLSFWATLLALAVFMVERYEKEDEKRKND